ncbi:amidohydrolase [Kordiimonas sp. SCSIO 12610]|uniref:amidohydrolase n=1 Tax=Kordiimonas sp. SCSIO 12610 TaxID=2829597 RepID=UPI00210EE406|nr:amidohydrolase [Kordiimonas sp. SCSIO 12610]UTW54593.1 amidohydrolase [Kordiimonas sp. SCSIO 12610]
MIKTSLLAIAVSLSMASGGAYAYDDLKNDIASDYGYLSDLFTHFHKNPELSYLENETSKRLGAELEAIGFDVTVGVGGTGVVAMMKNGEGPTVLVRADMDGLPVQERSGLSYASTVKQVNTYGDEVSVMHACGHDMHMTSLVGTARRLVAMRDKWQGTLMLVGQPAEERIGGAKAMIEDGLYERFGRPDYALALHVAARQPAGKIIYKSGLTYSSSDSVNIRVFGVGAHGAAPHTGKDPVVLASQIVLALQTLVAREISPLEPGVVTVGSFHSGTKHNIISEYADLQLTVRSNDEAVRAKLLAGIKRIAENMGRVAGLPEDRLPKVDLSIAATPTTVNDSDLTKRLDAVFKRELGEENLQTLVQTTMGAEDFPYFTRVNPPVPGFYFAVGGTPQADLDAEKNGGPAVAGHHSPLFKIAPEPSIKAGVQAMTVAVLDLMKK